MQMYKPDEHSRHFIAHIDSATDPKTGKTRTIPSNAQTVLCFVFGIEDAEPARKEGRSMAEFHYGRSQAHEFLFAQGWDKYHDRFFTRCYVQEGENAYDQAVKAQEKRIDQSPSSWMGTASFRIDFWSQLKRPVWVMIVSILLTWSLGKSVPIWKNRLAKASRENGDENTQTVSPIMQDENA